ncbi:thiopeptide-type bacteriocin biosynthesis protein [Saccharopolyspora sp. SCSIO 74807]|uniref:thiopeptide-type bacteriocin biosynthesis protein n=1 Tax=Saccharopolyspora sp. SCSIO 74807 TaxID=3118084 RepID=UPI0030CD3EF1
MPLNQLNTSAAPAELIATAVRSVMAGETLPEAAAAHDLDVGELADALDTYDRAGRAAVYDRTADTTWWQAHLEFSAWEQAELIAASALAPLLNAWCRTGLLRQWWFIRKAPSWRLRLQPDTDHDALRTRAAAELDRLVQQGHLASWRPSHYEPEALAFGGPSGIRIAHTLFSADSANLLAHLHTRHVPLGRVELSMLLCTQLFRAAGQEQFEAGDIWHRVTYLRPHPQHPSTDTGHHTDLTRQLRTLLTYDARPTGPLFAPEGSLHAAHDWAHAFHEAGRDLARAARESKVHRGIRHILAHHVIFHWNRLGLDTNTQHALAHAATCALLPLETTP